MKKLSYIKDKIATPFDRLHYKYFDEMRNCSDYNLVVTVRHPDLATRSVWLNSTIIGNLNHQMTTINETQHMAVILATNTFFSVRILMYLTQYLLYLT